MISAEVKSRVKKLLWSRFFGLVFLFQLTLHAAMALLVYTQIPISASAIGLHYSIYLGIDLVGPTWYYWALIGCSAVMFIVHTAVGMVAEHKGLHLFRLLAIASLPITGAIAITVYWGVALTRTLL